MELDTATVKATAGGIGSLAAVGAFLKYGLPQILKFWMDHRAITRLEANERYSNILGEIDLLKTSRGELAFQNTEQANQIRRLSEEISGWFSKAAEMRDELAQVREDLLECQQHRETDRRKLAIPVAHDQRKPVKRKR